MRAYETTARVDVGAGVRVRRCRTRGRNAAHAADLAIRWFEAHGWTVLDATTTEDDR